MSVPERFEQFSGLTRYEQACRAVADAVSVDEAKEFRDKSEAMRAYARQAKNRQLEVQAAEIRLRAERRIGELMAAQRDAGMLSGGGRPSEKTGFSDNPVSKPTLSDAGIDKNLANRARKLAAVPEKEFESHLSDWRERVSDETERVTMQLLGAGEKAFVEHNTGNNEWYTPPAFLEAARAVLGGFDLDPASSEIANGSVQAERYFTESDNGLEREWSGRIWMNPPYAANLVGKFADKFAETIEAEKGVGIVLVNNASETGWWQRLAGVSAALCFPKSRVKFLRPEGDSGAPLQGQTIFYAGPDRETFREVFSDFGFVVFCHE